LREGCSLVGLGLYLTRSTLRIQNSQLPVGCRSTCGSVRLTPKVTLLHRSCPDFEPRYWPCWTCQSLVFPGCLRFGLLWTEGGQAHQPVSQNYGYTQGGWATCLLALPVPRWVPRSRVFVNGFRVSFLFFSSLR